MKKIILFVVCFLISSLYVVDVKAENNVSLDLQGGEQFYSVNTTAQVTLTKKDFNTYEIIKCRETKVKVYDVTRGKYIEENGSDILIIGSSGQLTLEKNLEEGEYLIEEIEAPAGYIKKKYPQTFYVENNMGPIININIYNQPIDYNIELRTKGEIYVGVEEIAGKLKGKYDIRGIDNVKYGLYARENILDASGNIIYSKDSLVTYINIEMGLASLHELPYGYYYLKQLECPDEFILNDGIIEINLTGEDRFIFIELFNIAKKGNIIIYKTDGEIGLQGAEFMLQDEKYGYPVNIVTDNFGYSIIESLPYDTYFLLETKAPIGYLIDNKQKTIVLQEDNLEYELINEKETMEEPSGGEDMGEQEPVEKPNDNEDKEEQKPAEEPSGGEDMGEQEPVEKPNDNEDKEEQKPAEEPSGGEDMGEQEPVEDYNDNTKDEILGNNNNQEADTGDKLDNSEVDEEVGTKEPIEDEIIEEKEHTELEDSNSIDNRTDEISDKYTDVVVENPSTAVSQNHTFLNILILLSILVVFYTFKA